MDTVTRGPHFFRQTLVTHTIVLHRVGGPKTCFSKQDWGVHYPIDDAAGRKYRGSYLVVRASEMEVHVCVSSRSSPDVETLFLDFYLQKFKKI